MSFLLCQKNITPRKVEEIRRIQQEIDFALEQQPAFVHKDSLEKREKQKQCRQAYLVKEDKHGKTGLEKKREYDRNYKRVQKNYNVPLGSPPRHSFSRYSCAELEIREFIKSLFPTAQHNVFPLWLRSPFTQRLLELDIFIEEERIAIEAQDPRHFSRSNYVFTCDLIKERLCCKNNVDLIQIPYYEKNYKNILIQKIQDIQQRKLNE